MKIHAVAFDIDGTLYDNTIMHLKSLPFAVRHVRLLVAFRRVRLALRQMRPIEDFHALQAELLGRELGVSNDAARQLIDRLFYGSWEEILHRVPVYDGVRRTVERLRSAGLKVAVASDFPVQRKLDILGIAGLWDCEISTEEVGYLKPNPEPFRALLDCLDEPPQRVLYVGNSYRYDVEGAKAVGMPTAHLVRRPPRNSVADFSFFRFEDLAEWVLTKV
jgi:putative hydrolase of the HAD superfamily